MITEYHVQLILNKMDELGANLKELIDLLKAAGCKITQQPTEMEVYMDEQKTPESVTINEQGISTTEGNSAPETREAAAEKTVAQDAKPAKSKTAVFKAYRAAGGKLSWKKWQDAGMPENADAAQV